MFFNRARTFPRGSFPAIIVPMSPETPSQGRANGGSGLTRRRLLAAGAAIAGAGFGVGAYARWIEPTWVEVTQNDLPVPSLPPAWEGARIAHLADFHLCPWVPEAYLARCIKQTADLKPDLVVVTGDFITIGSEEYGPRAARLLTDLHSPFGTFACLGNHEYGLGRPHLQPVRPSPVNGALEDAGVRVLNNASERLTRESLSQYPPVGPRLSEPPAGEADEGGDSMSRIADRGERRPLAAQPTEARRDIGIGSKGGDLWIAGVEDLWSARYDPARAMADVPSGAANLVLCHNPDAAEDLEAAGCGTILAGHTHGGQVQIPLLGPPILPVRNRQRYEGLHRVGGTWLYINRGLGWLWRVRLACRPEISLLTLRRSAPVETERPAG